MRLIHCLKQKLYALTVLMFLDPLTILCAMFDEDSVKGSAEIKKYDQYIEAMIKNKIDSPPDMSDDYDISNIPIVKDDTDQYHIRNFEQYSINPEREYCYCTLCKKIYNDKFIFKEHVRSTHRKNYTCHHCNINQKSFLNINHIFKQIMMVFVRHVLNVITKL